MLKVIFASFILFFPLASVAAEPVQRGDILELLNKYKLCANVPLTLRVIKYGQMRTMEVRPDRLSIMLDKDGKIQSITCG